MTADKNNPWRISEFDHPDHGWKWTVREVEGEPWPGKDREGDTCYVNTHFDNEPAAWASLEAEAKAWLSLAASGLKQAREDVARREQECAEAALALAGVMKDMPSNAPHEGPADSVAG